MALICAAQGPTVTSFLAPGIAVEPVIKFCGAARPPRITYCGCVLWLSGVSSLRARWVPIAAAAISIGLESANTLGRYRRGRNHCRAPCRDILAAVSYLQGHVCGSAPL